MYKIANYLKKLSDSWLFIVRTEKVRYFLYYGLTFLRRVTAGAQEAAEAVPVVRVRLQRNFTHIIPFKKSRYKHKHGL